MNETPLKWPAVGFTHTELGIFNGVDRHDVWSRYQKAIKTQFIIPTGQFRKAGKGKAAVEWMLNPNPPVQPVAEVVEPKTPKATKAPKVPKIPVVVVATVEPAKAPIVIAPVINPLPTVQPAKAPVVVAIENIVIQEPVVHSVVMVPTEMKEVCPVCKKPLFALKDANGYTVWCSQPMDVCSSAEAPAGHGKTVKDALEVLIEKWEFASTRGTSVRV